MKRRNFFKGVWDSIIKGMLLGIPITRIQASSWNPFRECYEPVQFAGKEPDMGCDPPDTYKPKCGEGEGEIFAQKCKKNYKPNTPCTDGYEGKCIPASAIHKGKKK